MEATSGNGSQIIRAHCDPNSTRGRNLLRHIIETARSGVQGRLSAVRTLGRILKRPAADILAYFDRPAPSDGQTEVINGRLEYLGGSDLGLRNLTEYIVRPLLEARNSHAALP